ncbi:Dynein heavy chain, domain-2,Dynein heavy chain domain,Dynein heavy chain, domain-1,Dynein heavy chain, P- [Cinara cedri]|uniref:Dynein heavy chain, cytoplasmic n=1 Tax=Cinara cedri TaxID=506608 RepID=A0A5E4NEM0_9HEMI|nr:Dynein heavy chain, domain-2,Dynein heavy chain domain,Dynein heavy chain, domain-1,Dynein heavy chain, P- [Cinara cedri]
MHESDWTNDVKSTIEEFVSTDRKMLFLFYENNILKATFCIPDTQTDTIMWFLKTFDKEALRLDNLNFLKYVSFGKIDTHLEKTMFLLLDSLYSPFIFTWLASEKDQFFEQYRAVIQELCSLRYKFLGMPSIYIPTIVWKFDENLKNVSEETLRVLENILNVYTLEIQKCLMDTERIPTQCEYMMEHIVDEIRYWKNRSDINRLYEYLGNQIVFICRKTIKLSELFSGNTQNVLNQIHISINCCQNFISVYSKVIQIYNSKNDGHWLIETKDVHMFLDRCKDIHFICKSMILFKRLNGNNTIPKPKFSFTKGLEFEKVIESIEVRFNKLINNLENVQNIIFNVNTTDWYQHELEFKGEVKELCTIIEQLLNDALNVTCNIEDALNILQSLHYFSNWPQLNPHFQKKTNEVYNMLINDISLAMQFYTDKNNYQIPSFMVQYSGVCITAMTEYKRITTLRNMISERPWLQLCTNIKKLNKMYLNYTVAYQELINNTFELWNYQLNTNYEELLEKNILVGNHNDQFWHLTNNLDSDTFDLVTEIEYWSLIEFKNIFMSNILVTNATKIKRLHRNASKIVNDYNTLIAGLSEQEMLLFSESIELCNKITAPMIQCYTWKQLDIDNYLLDCIDELELIMVYWTRYIEKIDSLICKSLILNCQCALENILELSVGDGSGPVPAILVDVSLKNNKIIYSSSLSEILAFSANFLSDILMTIKVIPRLSYSLKLSKNNLIPYENEISKNWICIKLQEKNNIATINALRQLRCYMHKFLILKNIWSTNKTLFFEKYKTFTSSAMNFNQDMAKYSIYKHQISNIKPVTQVAHFLVQTNILKDEIIVHCDEWQGQFSDLLIEMTTNLIEGFYQYAHINSLQVMTPPKNLVEMTSFIELRTKIYSEYNSKAKEFTLISDNIKVLVWSVYKNTLEDAEIMLKTKQNEFFYALLEKQIDIKLKARDQLQIFLETAPISTEWNSNVLYSVWKLVNTWDCMWEDYKTIQFWDIHVSEIMITVDTFLNKFNILVDGLTNKKWEIIESTLNSINTFSNLLPVIENLKNSAMKVRHWDEIRHIINKKFNETSSDFTIEKLMEIKIQNFSKQIIDVSKKSTMELSLEKSIINIKEIWASTNLNFESCKDKEIYYVNIIDDIFQLLENHLVELSVIKTSKYISIFMNETDILEKSLGLVMEVLEIILLVQRQYIYLENIFLGDHIRQKMPIESIDFDILTEEWKVITTQMYKENNLFKSCNSKALFKHLNTMNYRLEVIQRALETYIELKRQIFPRFYFISNRELLEILGNSSNPDSIQPYLKKLFNNIHKIKIHTNNNQKVEIQGMYSKDGEYVDWIQPIICDCPAEVWLSSVETAMRESLKELLKQVKVSLMKNLKTREKWIREWPGQLCITASQIYWTSDCTRALVQSKYLKHKYPLKKMLKKQKHILIKLSKVIRGDLSNTDRLKVKSLIVIEIHARDVIEMLYKSNCTDISAFEWTSQLRFYCDKKTNEIIIKQTNTKQLYGYEYIGNSGRLVITPLTDRCYLTLNTALHMYHGGHLKGSMYTGKTETIKDLGKHIAQYVIVINCSKNIDYTSITRVCLGLVQQGAWACFDNIHRLKIEVLSSITQQILSILSALATNLKTLVIDKRNITLIPTCGIFITTSSCYEDRLNLPQNLKSMFRTVSMIVPDNKLIAETMLFGEGFKDPRNVTNKIILLFSLCKQLLDKHNFYEYGLGSLIKLIKYAGKCKRENLKITDDEIILLAFHKMSLVNMTKEDLPIFMDIINNIFSDITLPETKNNLLIDAVKRSMLKNNHQPFDTAIIKTIQLYEVMRYRRSVIIIGDTGTAKSITWKTLKDTFTLLKKEHVNMFETVIGYVLNPKTLTIEELYGSYNQFTHEWIDGILSSIVRKICLDNGLDQKWVIFDGPIDSSWVENMSSAMDDNSILSLTNGEHISIPKKVSFLFEVEDLEVASPAIISRCGIVYNNHNDYSWRLYVDSWLNTCKFKLFKDTIKLYFNQYIDDLVTFKRLNCIEIVSLKDQNCIISLCKLLESCTFHDLADNIPIGLNNNQYKLLIKIWFIFCMIWSICGCMNEDGKRKIDVYIRGIENVFPIEDTVFHYYVDSNCCKFKHWKEKLSLNTWEYNAQTQFSNIIIPTIDIICYNYLIQLYLRKKQPVMLVGPSGCGKTFNVKNAFETMNKNEFSYFNITMTAHTTSTDVQDMIEEKLEKRTKELYNPLTGKTMITFLDDMHMPIKESCGSQSSLELIRHWVTYGFWYDKKKQCPKYIKNMLLICAMTVVDNVKNPISDRIMSCFSVFNIKTPEEKDIFEIYKTILSQHLTDFDESVFELGTGMTLMTISLYKYLVSNMTPSPTKFHYLFNLRDISKVFQGLLRSNIIYQNFKVHMLRLWCHEVHRVFYDRFVNENDKIQFLDQINLLLQNNYNLTYPNLCKSEKNPIFFNFLNEHMLYEEVIDNEYLKKFIENNIKEYNSNSEFVPLEILLFRDYIEHICRIVRVISQPMGHILLIGIGGSGRSSLSKIASWLCKYSIFTIEPSKSYGTSAFKEDLKLIYSETGIKNQPTSFLFNDMQIVNTFFLKIINNILSTGEVTNLFKENELEEIQKSLSITKNNLNEIESTEEFHLAFINQVKKNLHLILSFSPIENSFRKRLQQYPSLIKFTTIDWFLDWPKEALLEVATTSLSDLDILATISEEQIIHDIEKKRITRDEFISSLAFIFASIHHSVIEYTNNVKFGLKSGNNITPSVYLDMIFKYKKILQEKRIEKQSISIKLRHGLRKINDTSLKINDMTMELEKNICALNKKDLSEIKNFSIPPEGVKLVLEAIMTLKQADPSWAEAKRQLDDPSFLNQLKDFNKDHITDDILEQISVYIKNPDFDLDKIGTQSIAAKCFGMWLIAIERYARMYRTIAPKKASTDLVMAIVKEEQKALKNIEKNLTEKNNFLEKQKLEYNEKNIKKEHFITKAEELRNSLEKATKLIDELSKERKKWNITVNQIDMEFNYLPGDCVLSTAFVSYMGPFRFKSREFLMDLWLNFMRENGVQYNPNFEVTLFLTDPETIRNWNNNGLSNDRFSLENGVIINQSYRYPFIIDPQSLAWKWIKNIEFDNGLIIINNKSINSMHNLETALKNGYPILVQIDFENLDPYILSIIYKSIVKQRNKLFIQICNKLLPFNENFRIYITTKIKNSYNFPEILARTTIVDFAIQEEGLEEQLLKTLVNIENPSLEELKEKTFVEIEKNKKCLVVVQDELLKLLDESECSLLENEQLLQKLKSSKAKFSIINEQLQSSLSSQAEIYIAREVYRPCAKRACTLYFILNNLDKINPMYQYSLDFYIALFENSIKKSTIVEHLPERINHLNEFHTYAVYENVCHGLFEHHKLPFLFQICIQILIMENKINVDELEFLLNGAIEPKKKRLITTQCPNWLEITCWNKILALSDLPIFEDLAKSFEQFPAEWYTWYTAPNPENLELIGLWENKCNLFHRILLVHSLRLDRLSFSIKYFITKNLGSQFSETPIFNIKNIQNDKNAVIFILSPDFDPTNMLMNMITSSNKKDKFRSLSLGNGLESVATNLIQTGQKEGHWIFLANCHLLISWMPQLEKIIEMILSSNNHPDFRLWLSSKPHPKFPITLLQIALKVSIEQPKSLKNNMLHIYQNINEEQFSQNQSSHYKKILFNLCCFHSILIERKKFQNLGWNKIYDFNDSDFKVSENILAYYLNEYEEIPWAALKYLIGNIFYGGYIADIWDKRLLDIYVNQFFNANSITPFHKLVNAQVPENGFLQSYKDFITTLPNEDLTQTFGQHPNANVIYLKEENYLLCETLRYLQEQFNGLPDDNDKENKVLFQLSQILQNLPSLIKPESLLIERNIVNFVILHEITCYNNLLEKMKITLMTLKKGITGLILITPEFENMFQTIYIGKVPEQWLKTYPSLMNLAAWTQNLMERVKYFNTWAITNQQPVSVWLGAFVFPSSFLTSILQNESKNSSVQIDLLNWQFIPITTPLNDLTIPPNKGVYIHNLYLEGAGWDIKNMCLCEPLPLEFIAKLPVINFVPVEGKIRLKDFYLIPVYYCPERNNKMHSSNSCVVVLNLKSGAQNPDYWTKRGTAILLNL